MFSILSKTEIIILTKLNSLPNGKILDTWNLRAFADDKLIDTQKWDYEFEKIENIVGKGENAGYQLFF